MDAKLKNGKPMVGSINMGYKNYGSKSKYPWCLRISIALELKNVNENGLPVKAESDVANRFEDELLKEIEKYAKCRYIGHFYNDTFLDVYSFLDDPEKVNQYLQTHINQKGLTRPIAYEIKEDPNWATVNMFLK